MGLAHRSKHTGRSGVAEHGSATATPGKSSLSQALPGAVHATTAAVQRKAEPAGDRPSLNTLFGTAQRKAVGTEAESGAADDGPGATLPADIQAKMGAALGMDLS